MATRKVITAAEIAAQVGGDVQGNGAAAIAGVASLMEAGPEHLSFLGNDKYRKQMATTQAGVVLVPRGLEGEPRAGAAWVRCDHPSEAFSTFVVAYSPAPVVHAPGIHPQATVAADAVVPASTHVGPHAVVEPGAVIGERTTIGAGCYVGHGARIGDDCLLHPRVTVLERCVLGNRVTIHSGTVIGSDGFGFEQDAAGHKKIPQFGIVQVDDDVELGACVTVDRARFGRTWIKQGVKVDNLVQIAHNVVVGEGSLIVAQVGISGSVTIGRGVILAGQAGIPGHVTIGDRAVIMAKSGPWSDVEPGAMLMGFPGTPRREYLRQQSAIRKLPELAEQVKELSREVARLRDQLGRA